MLMYNRSSASAWFEYQGEGIIPDVAVLAKILTNGHLPMGAVMAKEEVAAVFQGEPSKRFLAGYTLAGIPPACAAAAVVLQAHERGRGARQERKWRASEAARSAGATWASCRRPL